MASNPEEAVLANILIVDDRPANIVAMEAVLHEIPEYRLFTASSGSEAIQLVNTVDFALILLDVQMPDMDGFETAKRIKQLERGRDVPIILVTAIYTEDPHVLRGYTAGAIDYVGKPFNPDILKAKVGVYANLYLKSRQILLQNKYLLEAEKAMRERHSIEAILETMPVGVIAADKTGKIFEINREASRIWGGRPLVGIEDYGQFKGWWPKTGKPIQPHEWGLARAIEKGETSQYEIIDIQTFDGQRKTVVSSAAPIRDNGGVITGAVDILQDITRQQEFEALLAKRA